MKQFCTIRKHLNGLLVAMTIFSSATMAHAAGWYQSTQPLPDAINAMVSKDYMSQQVWAAGNSGIIARSDDGGYGWNIIPSISTGNFSSIELIYGFPDTVVIAAADNGHLVRSADAGNSWVLVDTLTTNPINAMAYDGVFLWAGSENGELFNSFDYGQTWSRSILPHNARVTAMVNTPLGIYMVTEYGDTTVIRNIPIETSFSVPTDTLTGVKISSAYMTDTHLVLGGEYIIDGSGVLAAFYLNQFVFDTPIVTPTNTAGVTALGGMYHFRERLWVATIDGGVYEGSFAGKNLHRIYQTQGGDHFTAFAARPIGASEGAAWAADTGRNLYRFGFVVRTLYPGPNSYITHGLSQVQLSFSALPNITLVQTEVKIQSNIRGSLGFSAAYEPTDSTTVNLTVPWNSLPGEEWNVLVPSTLQDTSGNFSTGDFNFNIYFTSSYSNSIDFDPISGPQSLGVRSTNFVNGIFNNDVNFDLITFAGDTLYCFAGQSGGGFAPPERILMPLGITLQPDLIDQLRVTDFNLDGLPDLVLFDNARIVLIENTSSAGFAFTATRTYYTPNIRDIALFMHDNIGQPDLLIASDSLIIRDNISTFDMGSMNYYEPVSDLKRVIVANADFDGAPDLAAVDINGALVFRRGIHANGFDAPLIINGNYQNIMTSDFNSDGLLDFFAQSLNQVHLYRHSDNWVLTHEGTAPQTSNTDIFSINGADQDGDGLPDLVIAGADKSLKFFKNYSIFGSVPDFQEITSAQQFTTINPAGLVSGDFNQDSYSDLAVFDTSLAALQIANKTADTTGPWTPNIDTAFVAGDSIMVRWSQFPTWNGSFSFYRVYRDTVPQVTTPLADIFTVTDTLFADHTAQRGKRYYYAVEAWFNEVSVTPLSPVWEVMFFNTLSGSLTGVLSDTTMPYLVTGQIQVNTNDSLRLASGVKLIFSPGTGFDIFGKLKIDGAESQMVSLRAYDPVNKWSGLTIFSGSDTLSFSWFDITGADVALQVIDRPLYLGYAGLDNNNIAIDLLGTAHVQMKHMILHHNGVALQTNNQSRALVKNFTIVDNSNEAVLVNHSSILNLKNSIIWNNNNGSGTKFPDVRALSTQPANLQFTTLDSISGNFLMSHISRITPLFQLPDSMLGDYIPDTLSATIDAGDPQDDFSLEPMPNGGRINQGVYGGLPFAMPTYQPRLDVKPDTLRLAATMGASDSSRIRLHNGGTRPLDISGLTLHQAEFNYQYNWPVTLQPDDSVSFDITFTPGDRITYHDIATISNNDPHYPFEGFKYDIIGQGLNTAPVVTAVAPDTVLTDSLLQFQITATDHDLDPLQYQAVTLPGWLTLSPGGELNGVPAVTDTGNAAVSVRVFDSFGGEDFFNHVFHVKWSNQPPHITTTALVAAFEDEMYADTVFATDPENRPMTFAKISGPAWLQLNTNPQYAALSGIPLQNDVGTFPVQISVTDQAGARDTLTSQIEVINVNDRPQFITNTLPNATEDQLYQQTLSVFDEDGDALNFTALDLPAWLSLSTSGELSGTPENSDVAVGVPVRIVASDPTGASDTLQVSIDVINTNDAPVLITSALSNGVQGVAYLDSVRAVDPDNETLNYIALNIPGWMQLTPQGMLSGLPGNSDVGENIPVVIRVQDPQQAADTLTTTIRVLNTNDAPEFITQALPPAIEDSSYQFALAARDIDGDPLQFLPLQIPVWMEVAPDGSVTGVPQNEDVAADVPVSFRVTDGNGASDTLNTVITVINTNDAPVFTFLPDTVIFAYVDYEQQVSASDDDGDNLVFGDQSTLFNITDDGWIRFRPVAADTGRHNEVIGVSDAQTVVRDTARFHIVLPPIPGVTGLAVTPADRALTIQWDVPDDPFYSGSVLRISANGPITLPGQGLMLTDTSGSAGSQIAYTVTGLEIGKDYFLSCFHYYYEDVRLFGAPAQTVARTSAPQIVFDNTARQYHVPQDSSLASTLIVRNSGEGTLLYQFLAQNDSLQQTWLSVDTSTFVVAPGDSAATPVTLHPPRQMPAGDYTARLRLYNNDAVNNELFVDIRLQVLQDNHAPAIFVTSRPDSISKSASAHFRFTASDTNRVFGWNLGDPLDSLRCRYLFRNVTNDTIVSFSQEMPLGPIDFYPLPDNEYEFRLWVFDSHGNGNDITNDAWVQRFRVRASEVSMTAGRWYLASMPREQSVSLAQFEGDSTLQAFRWNDPENKYEPFADSSLSGGEGLWLLSLQKRDLTVRSLPLEPGDEVFSTTITPGWNQVGVPSGYALRFRDMSLHTPSDGVTRPLPEAANDGLIAPAVYWYVSSHIVQGYEWAAVDSAIALPWRGYWLFSEISGELQFTRIPAFISLENDGSASTGLAKETGEQWQIPFTISNDRRSDGGNVIGVAAADQRLPVFEPPHFGEFCSGWFDSENGKTTADIREPFSSVRDVKKWQMNVTTSEAGKLHTIHWPDMSAMNDLYVYLVDPNREEIVNCATVDNYTFTPMKKDYALLIYATHDPAFQPEIVPLVFRLDANYPNPFNPVTNIRFGIPESGAANKTTLRIFNILGQEIARPVNGRLTAGYHTIQWNGHNAAGRQVASGVYFYQLQNGDYREQRKMILIK